MGVTNVGLLDRTNDPVPVDVVVPVPPYETAKVPPVIVSVPDPVTGPPVKIRPEVPPATFTEVTVPAPVIDIHVGVVPGPAEVRT